MKRLRIDILGISEHRWPDSGKIDCAESRMFYSGTSDGANYRGRNGVAIIVNKEYKDAVQNVVAHSDRVMEIQLIGTTQNINLIQVYAPTADKSDEEIEEFYSQIQEISKSVKKQDINIIMGDFNAKVGAGKVKDVAGEYGLGARNDRGNTLVQFCQQEEYVIKNTFFKMSPRRLYTWKAPSDKGNKIVRNQIDYFMTNKRFQNSMTRVAAYPGADIGSDHNPIVADLRVRFKKLKKMEGSKSFDIEKLQIKSVNQNLKEVLQEFMKLEEIDDDVEKIWGNMKTKIKNAAEKTLGKTKS